MRSFQYQETPRFSITTELAFDKQHKESLCEKAFDIGSAHGICKNDTFGDGISVIFNPDQPAPTLEYYETKLRNLINIVGKSNIESQTLYFNEPIKFTGNAREAFIANMMSAAREYGFSVEDSESSYAVEARTADGHTKKFSAKKLTLTDSAGHEISFRLERNHKAGWDVIGQNFVEEGEDFSSTLSNIFKARQCVLGALAKLPPAREEGMHL